MDSQKMMKVAIEAYQHGTPVIVFTKDGNLVHGRDELEGIVATGVTLKCNIINLDMTVDDWNDSDYPEIFGAARSLWLSEELPPGETEM